MRNFIIALALTTAPALAEDQCAALGETAEVVMEWRQAEYPRSELELILRQVLAAEPGNTDLANLNRRIISTAYEENSYTTSEVQARMVREFRNEWETRCYEGKLYAD